MELIEMSDEYIAGMERMALVKVLDGLTGRSNSHRPNKALCKQLRQRRDRTLQVDRPPSRRFGKLDPTPVAESQIEYSRKLARRSR